MFSKTGSDGSPVVQSRFAELAQWQASVLLVIVVAVIGFGVVTASDSEQRGARTEVSESDTALYEAVAARVASGENYYSVAAEEQRARDYPLRPFVTVREPTLAYLTALVGGSGNVRGWLGGLAFVAAASMAWRLESVAYGRPTWWSSAAIFALALGTLVGRAQAATHEVWAGLLIACSLALWTNRRWWPSVIMGLGAVLMRELALPYLLVMAYFAWREGRRREMQAWAVAVAVFAAAFTAHAVLVQSELMASDPQSQGWLRFGGWPFVLDLVRSTSFFTLMPLWATAVAVPLALLGWFSRRSPTVDRLVVLIAGYLLTFMIVGRPENVHWGFLFVVILLPGLAFAPSSMWQLVSAVIGRRGNRPDVTMRSADSTTP